MNVLICDDKPSEINKLSDLLSDLGYEALSFTSSEGALEHIRTGATTDVCILDIIMPGMDGIELARRLREAGFAGDIVFLSTSKDYGPQTYEVRAFHYLIKPPTPEGVRQVLDDIKARRDKDDRAGLTLRTAGVARFVLFRDIEYAEVTRNYVTFSLLNGKAIEIRSTFTEVAPQLLGDDRFVRCHQSYIVNMDAIASMTTREIATVSGARIPIAKSYAETKMRYLDRGLRGEAE